MFTIDQIKAAHYNVKTGADFPAYIRDLKELGVISYENFVTDGHSVYNGDHNMELSSPSEFPWIEISNHPDRVQFQQDLKAHQQGLSDFATFREQAAANGVEKWILDAIAMTCTYFDMAGNTMLMEKVPG